MPLLSICIPTYNRSACLAELLDSIAAQDTPDLEVVVADDASPDDTVEVMGRYAGRFAHFVPMLQARNVGVDRNIAAVTARATGDYIWLFGDDDRLEPGGIGRVLAALSRWPDMIALTVGVVDYDPTLRNITGIRRMPPTQHLVGAGAAFSRFAELLGYISATLVRRAEWNIAAADPRAVAMTNLYSQVYIAGLAVGATGGWGVLAEPCVNFRSGNDQLKRRVGWLERLRIDVRGYDEIARLLFPDRPAVQRAAARRVFDTHVIARIVNAKTEGASGQEIVQAARYLCGRYASYPSYWIKGLPLLLAPRSPVRACRRAYQRLSRRSGVHRARQFCADAAKAL
ncbi:glycosyltransferase family 2 protein [Novosphingobium guangzhouense]|uniref:Glycosyl transferase n=1 Tax=Novosphingobium guangzhouense TaxID=1850347 RepID=A0A2K2G166_9SPHN|nr:glycosyltransferase family 2 protein [Novosphingobium guangzhouense]PNU04767.1 glycosyl transferase [Novosphingobium guangzhouense]